MAGESKWKCRVANSVHETGVVVEAQHHGMEGQEDVLAEDPGLSPPKDVAKASVEVVVEADQHQEVDTMEGGLTHPDSAEYSKFDTRIVGLPCVW